MGPCRDLKAGVEPLWGAGARSPLCANAGKASAAGRAGWAGRSEPVATQPSLELQEAGDGVSQESGLLEVKM